MPITQQLPGPGAGNLLDPTIPVGYDTALVPNANTSAMQAEDGTTVVLNYYTAPVYGGSIVFPFCTDSERIVLEAFYTTNRFLVWSFNHPGDGHQYSLYFTQAPNIQRYQADGNLLFTVTFAVTGYRY